MSLPAQAHSPSPERIFEALNAYQRTASLKAAIELDLFTVIGEGLNSISELSTRCRASERGIRALCDYLVVLGFLSKDRDRYALNAESAKFLDRRSPACIASSVRFLAMPAMTGAFSDFTSVVRSGTPTLSGGAGTTGPEDPIWVEFAVAMAPMQAPLADLLAKIVGAADGEKWKVLDVAAGHGAFGIEIAKRNPSAEIFAQDWPRVLEVARANASEAGVTRRFHELPGSAFEIDFGGDYDIVLLTNFLQLFDRSAIQTVLRRVHAALKPGGRAVTLGFITNEDRVTPPMTAAFAIIMLGTTTGGDAYSFQEYAAMFVRAGFRINEHVPLPAGPQSVIISQK